MCVLCRGWGPTTLDEDTVYTSDWEALKKKQRSLGSLINDISRNEDGYMIYHNMIVPRKPPAKNKRSTKSSDQSSKRRKKGKK